MSAFVSGLGLGRSPATARTSSVGVQRVPSSFISRSTSRARSPAAAAAGAGAVRMMAGAETEAAVRKELSSLFATTPCQPIMVRLAWHDAGTYDVESKTGGANASIRFMPESGHGANAGLKWAMDALEPIKKKHEDISYADLYQLASVVAIESAGGPSIPFKMGRKDATEKDTTPDGRLPDATKRMGHLRDVFYRMGLDDKAITLLSGAHTLGRAHADRSGFEGPWTKEPLVFDNSYFVEILKPESEADPALLRLASDMALLDEPDTKALCELYAKDKETFFSDYSDAHLQLSQLGFA